MWWQPCGRWESWKSPLVHRALGEFHWDHFPSGYVSHSLLLKTMGKPWENGGFNGKTHRNTIGKWRLIVDLPVENGDFP